MTTFEVTRDEIVFAVGSPVSFDVVPVAVSFTTGPAAGLDGQSFTPRGPWDSGTTYAIGDVVSFSGGNYILYASPPTGGDPDVDTAHWDVLGSGSGVSPSRSIATTSPLAGGGDLTADRTLTLNIGTGLTTSGGNLVPDFGSGSGKVTQGNDSRLSDSRTPTAHASSHTDGGSDEIAVALAQLTQSGATTGQVPKWNGSAWAPASESGGGSSLPDPTGNEGAVLVVDTGAWAARRAFTSPDGETIISAFDGGGGVDWDGAGGAYAYADVDSTQGAFLAAGDGVSESATVKAKSDGTIVLESTSAVTVTPGDGFHVVGDVGETVLSGDDYLMSTASDTDVQAPGATFARARGSMVSKSAVTNGDILAYPLYAQGHDGTSLVLAGQITAEVDGTVATGKVPTRIRIATADADGVLTDRMVIGADGTTDVLGDFTVNGSPVSGGGGGLVLIDSGTFSASSGVSLPTSVFDGTYDDYRLIGVGTNASNGDPADLRVRLRASGSDDTSSNYSLANWLFDGGNVSVGGNGLSYWLPNLIYETHPGWSFAFDLFGPAIAAATRITGAAEHTYTAHRMLHYGGRHAATSAFDSLTFYPSAGTITGRWAVFGYAK